MRRTTEQIDRDEMSWLASFAAGETFPPSIVSASRWKRFVAAGWVEPSGRESDGVATFRATDAARREFGFLK